jgi:IS5 family transposase
MSRQIIDASLVPAPKQRNTDDERQAIKDGESAQDIWLDNPAKAAQKEHRCALDAQDRREGAL